jgi:hypothetical protein
MHRAIITDGPRVPLVPRGRYAALRLHECEAFEYVRTHGGEGSETDADMWSVAL